MWTRPLSPLAWLTPCIRLWSRSTSPDYPTASGYQVYRLLGAACLQTRGVHKKAEWSRKASQGEGASEQPMAKVEIPVDVQTALRRLYHEMSTPLRVSVISTGAGGHVATWMLGTPGASSVLVDYQSPYSIGAINSLLGGKPSGPYCSSETALALAKTAYARAVELTLCDDADEASSPLHILSTTRFFGVACSAAVVSTEPKKGDHRAYVAVYSDGGATVQQYSLKLTKGARDRPTEDYAVSKAVLVGLLEAVDREAQQDWVSHFDLGPPAPLPAQEEDHILPLPLSNGQDPIDALSQNATDHVFFVPSPLNPSTGLLAYPGITLPFPVIIYPGSFNPLHEGHTKLAAAAQMRIQALSSSSPSSSDSKAVPRLLPVIYELASLNADKGWVGSDVLRARLRQFADPSSSSSWSSDSGGGCVVHGQPVVLTRTPLFVDKARLFPGAYFLIGADTVKRLVDAKYYGHSMDRMILALSEIKHRGCHFVVGGRVEAGRFITSEDVLSGVPGLPEAIKDLFIGLSEEEFRLDICSSEIRARLASQQQQKS